MDQEIRERFERAQAELDNDEADWLRKHPDAGLLRRGAHKTLSFCTRATKALVSINDDFST